MCKKKYVHYKFNKINKIKLLAQIELALESYRTGSCLKRHTHKTKSCKSLERVYHASPSLDRAWDYITNLQFSVSHQLLCPCAFQYSRLQAKIRRNATTANNVPVPVPDHTTYDICSPEKKKYILASNHNPTNFALISICAISSIATTSFYLHLPKEYSF